MSCNYYPNVIYRDTKAFKHTLKKPDIVLQMNCLHLGYINISN